VLTRKLLRYKGLKCAIFALKWVAGRCFCVGTIIKDIIDTGGALSVRRSVAPPGLGVQKRAVLGNNPNVDGPSPDSAVPDMINDKMAD
jgi:hypothetical protein